MSAPRAVPPRTSAACPYCPAPAAWWRRLLMRTLPALERLCARLDRHIADVCAPCHGTHRRRAR